MRTTVDLDPQVLLILKEKAARQKTTLGKVIDDLVKESRSTYNPAERQGVPLLPNRKPGSVVTIEHIRSLRDEDE